MTFTQTLIIFTIGIGWVLFIGVMVWIDKDFQDRCEQAGGVEVDYKCIKVEEIKL